jgi:hypothetical protein
MRNFAARSWVVLGIALLVILGVATSKSASGMHFLAGPQSDDDKKHDDADAKHHDDDGKKDHDMDGMHHSGHSHHHGNPGGTPPPPPPPPTALPPTFTTNTCPSGTLTAGGADVDLDLSGHMCTVGGLVSTYIFHNVNIHDGGILRFLDQQTDFYAENILVENNGTLRAGVAPDLPIGTAGGKLTIHLYGAVTDPGVTCKSDPTTCGVPSTTWTNTNSATTCIPPTIPLPGGVVDCFYKYGMLDDGDLSNAYFGHKVLAVSYGGTLHLRGHKGVDPLNVIDANPSNTGQSWKRLDGSLIPGAQLLHVDGFVNWQQGDHIVVTTTDYLPGHSEELIITEQPIFNFVIRRTTIHFTTNPDGVTAQGLKWAHYGQTFPIPAADVTKLGLSFNHVDTRAAVALLSRSIRIVSEGTEAKPNSFPETAGNYFGGHTIVRQGFASYQVQGVEFYLMGQGGDITHYPVHFHMARKTPQPANPNLPAVTYVKDCSVHESMTRWFTIHATEGVTLQRNVGYLSIGHGYYLEDGTEINNKLYANIGIFARAAVDNPQNRRQVPGILASPGEPGAEIVPYHTDYDHPAVFWIMNGWNDFRYNMAAGAGSCGMCYWLLPGANSGPSRKQKWDSYASEQIDLAHAGETPLMKFIGNTCSTAMNSFETVGNTSPCLGVGDIPDGQHIIPIPNPKAPPRFITDPDPPHNIIPNPKADAYYPQVNGGFRLPTKCDTADCSAAPRCGGTLGVPEQSCMVTTLDHYTTSFNWAQTNFAAVWLRLWWYLMTDSAITDVQNGGLTFITGGGYTRSDAAQGFWSLVRKSVFIGNSQPNVAGTQFPVNTYAAAAGPFNPKGLECDVNRIDYCESKAEGISMETTPFAVNQRLFSVYDGPAFQDSNGYYNIHSTTLDDCTPGGEGGLNCLGSKWMNAHAVGVLRGLLPENKTQCYLPNAAIAWKQPNGFYYPPAFHSTNLVFENVDIRHFVVEPLFSPGTFKLNPSAAEDRYCTWRNDMFVSFTDIDRQTELSDDDGSLTGLVSNPPGPGTRESISVNEDPFFNAPVETPECASDDHPDGVSAKAPPATAKTSPYEYLTLAMQPACSVGDPVLNPTPPPKFKDDKTCGGNWGKSCTTVDTANNGANSPCFGVPLYREYVTATEQLNNARPVVKMMGQGSGQRSTLTVNHGKYFVDTTVTFDAQKASFGNVDKFSPSVFQKNQTYYFFLVYAKPSTQQTYDIFVGIGADPQQVVANVKPVRVGIDDNNFKFNAPAANALPFITVAASDYNATTGILTVHVDVTGYGTEFTNDRKNFCAPPTYCQWSGSDDTGQCGCKPGTDCKDNSVCAWGPKDTDCPTVGCFGFGIKFPDQFANGPKPGVPPAPKLFSQDPDAAKDWAVPFDNVVVTKSGQQCRYPSPPQ